MAAQTTFFKSIAMVDMERFHSAILKWVLSDCNAFGLDTKKQLLNAMFKCTNASIDSIVSCENEWQDMDLVVKTESADGSADVWVLENKIKCEEHDDQLNRYCNQIFFSAGEENPYHIAPANQARAHFAFLTLLERNEEHTYSDEPSVKWTPVKYEDITTALRAALEHSNENVDKQILEAYVTSTEELINKAKKAACTPELIFRGKTKDDNEKSLLDFIEKYKLRRLLQRYYFLSIKNDVQKSLDGIIKDFQNDFPESVSGPLVSSGASSGEAEMSFPISKAIQNLQNAMMGIQLQGGTFKVDVSLDYWNVKNREQSSKMLMDNRWLRERSGQKDTYFDKYVQRHDSGNEWKINLPKGKCPRMSISKKMAGDYNVANIVKGFRECFSAAKEIIGISRQQIQNSSMNIKP